MQALFTQIVKMADFIEVVKKAAEEYIEEYKNIYNLKFTVLRFGSLYGKRAQETNGLNKYFESHYREKIQYQGNIKSIREYINVEDAAKGSVEVLQKNMKTSM